MKISKKSDGNGTISRSSLERSAILALTGDRVRLLRSRANNGRGLTQKALAERSGVDAAVLSRVEQGKLGVSLPVAYRLADALGVGVEAVLPAPEFVAAEVKRLQRERA